MKKILASVAAAALAVSAMSVAAFADGPELVVPEGLVMKLDKLSVSNGEIGPVPVYENTVSVGGNGGTYNLAAVEDVDYSKVVKIEAKVETDDYVNGTIGVSSDGKWTAADQQEGTGTWVLDNLNGIDVLDDDGNLKEDAVQVQFWWLNPGTVSLYSVTLYDADGAVLQEETKTDLMYEEVEIKGNDKHEVPELNLDGKVRLNIVHPWSGGEFVFADYKDFVGATSIKAQITVEGVTDSFTAQLQGSDNGDPAAFSVWGNPDEDKGESDVVTIDKDGTYTLTLTAPTAIGESANFFLMVNTSVEGVEKAEDPAESEDTSTSEEPTVTTSEDATTTSGVAGDVNGGDTGDKNQPTGLVIAVVPAAVAAAAVVISKKRK